MFPCKRDRVAVLAPMPDKGTMIYIRHLSYFQSRIAVLLKAEGVILASTCRGPPPQLRQ